MSCTQQTLDTRSDRRDEHFRAPALAAPGGRASIVPVAQTTLLRGSSVSATRHCASQRRTRAWNRVFLGAASALVSPKLLWNGACSDGGLRSPSRAERCWRSLFPRLRESRQALVPSSGVHHGTSLGSGVAAGRPERTRRRTCLASSLSHLMLSFLTSLVKPMGDRQDSGRTA